MVAVVYAFIFVDYDHCNLYVANYEVVDFTFYNYYYHK